ASVFFFHGCGDHRLLHSFPTRRSSDLPADTACSFDAEGWLRTGDIARVDAEGYLYLCGRADEVAIIAGYKVWPREVEDCLLAHRSEEHTSELQSRENLVCRLLLEKKKN